MKSYKLSIGDMPSVTFLPMSSNPSNWWQSAKDWLLNNRTIMINKDWFFTIPTRFGKDGTVERQSCRICIPRGFMSDGASIPRSLWWLLDPFGIMLLNGLIHDFGYRYNFLLDENKNPIWIDAGREFFDDIFEDVGVVTNGTHFLDDIAFGALRLCGGSAWNADRKLNALVFWHEDQATADRHWAEIMTLKKADVDMLGGIPRDIYLIAA